MANRHVVDQLAAEQRQMATDQGVPVMQIAAQALQRRTLN
ncbi:hypothetical protein M2202_006039 [Bradyrhizobium japonicum]|jgi:hypothetical protein|nr:hypothetical protein [Bradyrhizobium japonicum]MCP1787289.1 hypothetical protein [Bradyrhizobium japonicum]MCP1809166.1 hypothetical protein [Bradyrhizobium japonicum]MCP1818099.1 hypothetical protein [Bradyrhizobium japonicum]MCP1870392.1 hypothetical protein [Bradyrhizobium japonicum]